MAKAKPPKPPSVTPPAKVTGVIATVTGPTSVFLMWNGVPDATEYYIYRNGVVTGIVVYPNSYIDNNHVFPNTVYDYQIAASIGNYILHTAVLGEKSDIVTVKTPNL